MNDSVSEILLNIKSFSINTKQPFRFVSGILSPIYLDCRRLISYPHERKIVIDRAVDIVKNEIGEDNIDVIAGGETAGIPFASWLSDRLNKSMIYVRKIPKGYGKKRQIEGVLNTGQRVLLFEDMVTNAESKINFFNGVKNDGGKMEHCLVIFEYGYESARQILMEYGIELYSMTDLNSVLTFGKKTGYFSEEEIKEVRDWFKHPDEWGKKFQK